MNIIKKKPLFKIVIGLFLATLMVGKSSLANAHQLNNVNFEVFLPLASRPYPAPVLLETKPIWKALFIVYRNTDVDYEDKDGNPKHMTLTMPDEEFSNGLWGLREFPAIANDFSNKEAVVLYDIVIIDRPITTITTLGNGYWLSPNDTRAELDLYAPKGKYDSVLVYWPALNTATGELIPYIGWGLGMGANWWSNNATYAVVWNAPSYWWGTPPKTGQVWLHEWLHGACPFYASKGYKMPSQDADGGGSHGYVESPTEGWAPYYRDLMTGNVLDNGALTGIIPAAWQSGSILKNQYGVYVDYFVTDTTTGYFIEGDAVWNSTYQNIVVGTSLEADNELYRNITFDKTSIISGRVYIPDANVGQNDTVSVTLKDDKMEYKATLAYGNALPEKNHISIMRNEEWGSLYSINLTPGWYTIKLKVDVSANTISMKTWQDGQNEPDWQLAETIITGWRPTLIGFEHHGLGSIVDDLIVESP